MDEGAATGRRGRGGAAGAAPARTLTVAATGGADFGDIASAIAEASSGDTIEVAAGNYYGSIDFSGKQLHIHGAGAAETWIWSSPGQAAVRAHSGEGKGAILEGFTVTGGGNAEEGAIDESFSSLTLRNVTLSGNRGFVTIYARSAIMTLDRVTIEADNATTEGVQVQGRRGTLIVKDSTIACGDSAFGYMMEHGAAFLDGTTFACAGATAAQVFHSDGRIQRSIFDGLLWIENETTDSEFTYVEGSVLLGGASVIVAGLDVRNAVVAGQGIAVTTGRFDAANVVMTGAECAISQYNSTVSVGYSDFWNNGANACGGSDPVGSNGNFEADPLFVDADAGDWQLQPGSPCIDAGSPVATYADVDGSRSDVGAYGGPFTLGGGW
jgi:hypothetical protein